MKKPENLELRIFSEKQWELIEEAVEKGDELALIRLTEPERELELEETAELEQENDIFDMNKVMPDPVDPQYFLYNGIAYERPKEEVMDALSKFAKEHGLSKTALRYAVENIDNDYTVKYQAQYSEAVREFINEDDKTAMMTAEDRSAYYQEQEIEEEREEEEEEMQPHFPGIG